MISPDELQFEGAVPTPDEIVAIAMALAAQRGGAPTRPSAWRQSMRESILAPFTRD